MKPGYAILGGLSLAGIGAAVYFYIQKKRQAEEFKDIEARYMDAIDANIEAMDHARKEYNKLKVENESLLNNVLPELAKADGDDENSDPENPGRVNFENVPVNDTNEVIRRLESELANAHTVIREMETYTGVKAGDVVSSTFVQDEYGNIVENPVMAEMRNRMQPEERVNVFNQPQETVEKEETEQRPNTVYETDKVYYIGRRMPSNYVSVAADKIKEDAYTMSRSLTYRQYIDSILLSIVDEDIDWVNYSASVYGFPIPEINEQLKTSYLNLLTSFMYINQRDIVRSYNEFDDNIFDDIIANRREFFEVNNMEFEPWMPENMENLVSFGEILVHMANLFANDVEYGSRLALIIFMIIGTNLDLAEDDLQRAHIINSLCEHMLRFQIKESGLIKIGLFSHVVPPKEVGEYVGNEVTFMNEYNRFLQIAVMHEEDFLNSENE